jgi:LPS sulfotransferase NodH
MKKFFVMTRGRTGSTAIIDELGKVKGLRSAPHELFLEFDFQELLEKHPTLEETYGSMIPFKLWKTKSPWWVRIQRYFLSKRRLIEKYLKEVENSAFCEGAALFGFKVLSNHFEEITCLKDILLERQYRAIYLKRNIPRQVISGMIANQRGTYNTDQNYQDDRRYQIDTHTFQELVRWETQAVKNDLALLKSAGFDFIEVSYEEFMADRQAFFSRVLGFLGLPADLPEASSYSVMIKDLKYTIENYQAVADCAMAMGMRIE